MLLSDARVQQRLQNYVCAWESVRDVPRITVDFGDRKITRTLKGNTVLYVCLADGTVVDAMPGLYTPEDFLAQLDQSERLLELLSKTPPARRGEVVRAWHQRLAPPTLAGPPAEISVGKMAVEAPVLNALDLRTPPTVAAAGPPGFAAYTGRLVDASAQALSGPAVRSKLSGRDALRLDSSYSVTRLRPAVHLLLAELRAPRPEDCRRPLFQGLLKIPLDDPYLGMGSLLEGTPDQP